MDDKKLQELIKSKLEEFRKDDSGTVDYIKGVRDGELKAIEIVLSLHTEWLDKHEKAIKEHDKRTSMQERVIYSFVGAVALIRFLPELRDLIHYAD
jgi:hypothetical protein